MTPALKASLRIQLDATDRARKRKMLDCFASQSRTLAAFGVEAESFQPAPAFDFTKPPHFGRRTTTASSGASRASAGALSQVR